MFLLFLEDFLVKREPKASDAHSGAATNGSTEVVDYFIDELVTLDKCDAPGASLNGKTPFQLTVIQLKRLLACRGAPLSGRKPKLIER